MGFLREGPRTGRSTAQWPSLCKDVTSTSRSVKGISSTARDQLGQNAFLVLEHSGGPKGLGQVLGFDAGATTRTVIATGIDDPTSLSIDELTGRLFISSRGDGVIYSVPLP